MRFFKHCFRASAALILAALVFLVPAYAVDFRMVGKDTQFIYNDVTYTFRAHIDFASGGAIYGGASAKCSKPLQGGDMGVLAYLYDINGNVVQVSDILCNPDNRDTALSTTDCVIAPGTYYCGAVIRIYDASTGGYIHRYANNSTEPLEISTPSGLAPSLESYDRLARRNKEWLDQVELEREAEAAERAKQSIEQIFPVENTGDLRQRERERMAQEKAEIEAEIAQLARKSAEQLFS